MPRLSMLLPAFALLAAAPLLATSDTPVPLSPKALDVLAGRTAGKPSTCIQLRLMGSTQIVDETAVIYKQSSRLWYVNQPENGHCTQLRPRLALITRTSTGQLCSNDLVTIADPGSPVTHGSCGLGRFVPYTK